jgi:hypothetical protein
MNAESFSICAAKKKPMMANATPTIRCHDGALAKKQNDCDGHNGRVTP